MEALHDVVKVGKARYVGASPMWARQFQKERVTAPIIGATKITHLEEAVGALSVKLTQEEVAYLEELYVPHRIVGHQ
jgi:aryl-alcohol dehydrogenase-like predicted oxidoreductase